MSVLACDRNGCKNVMCDRYDYNYGYICDECFEELVATDPSNIGSFMWTSKTDPPKMRTREQYEYIFRSRHAEDYYDIPPA